MEKQKVSVLLLRFFHYTTTKQELLDFSTKENFNRTDFTQIFSKKKYFIWWKLINEGRNE